MKSVSVMRAPTAVKALMGTLTNNRGAYLIFRATSAALIRGRRLFKHCNRQIYFFYIFIQRYTFYLLIFLWTNTKVIVNLEL